jgi:hypothetical protein
MFTASFLDSTSLRRRAVARRSPKRALWRAQSTIAALVLLLSSTAALSAQTIRGVVVDDSTKLPLESAVITILNTRGAELGKPSARSDSLGRFTVHAGELGRYQVRVTRIGYQPLTSQNISFNFSAQVAVVTLNMTAAPASLGRVVVTGTTRLTNVELMSHVGFELRRSKGDGKFLDTNALATYGRQPAYGLLEDNRALFGLEFVSAAGGVETMRMLRGSGFCVPEVWIDGFEANPNTALLRLAGLGSDEIYGVEVYNGLQLPPPSIGGEIGAPSSLNVGRARGGNNQLRQNQLCGAVAIWTKAFAKEMQAKADAKIPPPL